MKANIIRAFIVTGALASVCAATGCVADRPSRNGVFDENQYIRKDFLIRPGNGGVDPGWFMKATVTANSTPNPLFNVMGIGNESGGSYVNFVATSDKLLMNNLIQVSQDQTPTGSISAQGTNNQETIDSWPITNVDLKYRVNLDGEKTNFYEENQELDWQQRQWVKVNFDKNDESDFIPFGIFTNEFLQKCTDFVDIAATLHPGSFYVDETNNYWQFSVDITVPITFGQIPSTTVSQDSSGTTNSTSYDTYCMDQFGYQGWLFQQMGRQNVTFTVMYSFMRAPQNASTSYDGVTQSYDDTQGTPAGVATNYMPLVIPEKDNIQRKYGAIVQHIPAIDLNTGLWTSRQLAIRHDPQAPQITYYFAPGFPNQYKTIFGNPQPSGCQDGCTYSGGGGIVDQTNAIWAIAAKASGQKAPATKLVVMDYDANLQQGQPPRQFGDVRYSFLRWISDLDSGAPWLGVTQFVQDPRTGQIVSTSINVNDFMWQDTVLARMNYYEQTVGAFCFANPGQSCTYDDGTVVQVPGSCKDGDTLPLVPAEVAANHNGTSTLYTKIQQYLAKPAATYGFLGPSNFIVQHDNDFFNALDTVLPYEVFADPGSNPYVVWEGGSVNYGSAAAQFAAGQNEAAFHALMSKIDQGQSPYDMQGDLANNSTANAANFLNQLQQLTLAHRDYEYVSHYAFPYRMADSPAMFTLPGLFQKDSRHCINGQWETEQQYEQNLIRSYYALIWWHEFGHSLGLAHNFMGSVDRNNFPHYTDSSNRDHIGLYTSTVMEYNMAPDRVFWAGSSDTQAGGVAGKPGWAPYDQSALAFIYANNATSLTSLDAGKAKGIVGTSVSGQSGTDLIGQSGQAVSAANNRWNDPLGYCPGSAGAMSKNNAGQACTGGSEIQYLFCSDGTTGLADHTRYTPFCRTFDFGTTPSEIIASEIDSYEWQYLWRNFPQYHKYYDFSPYANGPTTFFTEARRFLSSWAYDWSQGELSDNFRRLGVNPPAGIPAKTYYDDLSNAFQLDISVANQLYAATTQGLIQQSSGQRPYITVYDSFFGDTVQQGISVDKTLALQAFTALWPIDNYDQNQAAGSYLSGFSFNADPQYESVAEASCLSMVGGQYAMFPWAVPLGVQQFAMATHSTYYQQQATGGRPEMKDWIGGYTFTRRQDFVDFFRNLAVINNTVDGAGKPLCPETKPAGYTGSWDPVQNCEYDPTIATTPDDPEAAFHSDIFQQFRGPDFRRWIWVYLQDMNTYIAADEDRNVATYIMMFNYTSDVVYGEDDGNTGAPYSLELPLKYFLNYYQTNGN